MASTMIYIRQNNIWAFSGFDIHDNAQTCIQLVGGKPLSSPLHRDICTRMNVNRLKELGSQTQSVGSEFLVIFGTPQWVPAFNQSVTHDQYEGKSLPCRIRIKDKITTTPTMMTLQWRWAGWQHLLSAIDEKPDHLVFYFNTSRWL